MAGDSVAVICGGDVSTRMRHTCGAAVRPGHFDHVRAVGQAAGRERGQVRQIWAAVDRHDEGLTGGSAHRDLRSSGEPTRGWA